MQSAPHPDKSLSKKISSDRVAGPANCRGQRVLAEYLRAWGLRDPQAIADYCRRMTEECVASSNSDGDRSPGKLDRQLMRAAMADLNRGLDRVTTCVCRDDAEIAARRGPLAVKLQSLLDERPELLVGDSRPSIAEADELRRVSAAAVPPPSTQDMPEQPLSDSGSTAKPSWWLRRLIAVLATTARLLTNGWLSPTNAPRAILATLTLLTTAVGTWNFSGAIRDRGFGPWPALLLPLFAVLLLWISMSFWMATFGFLRRLTRKPSALEPPCLENNGPPITVRTAIVMPVYNEPPRRVFAGIRAIYESLQAGDDGSCFDFFILSDTTDPEIWLAEELAWAQLAQAVAGESRVYYRHRANNVARKSGNIADFCRRWGGHYKYMIVLDADSLMSGGTIREMVCRMERDDSIGILQAPSVPVNRESLFARCQQFAAQVYGPTFMEGFNWWAGADGNYWGHNAIIRVEAFTKCCGLPKLPGDGPLGGEILSHDFVEAALMQRAGYKVCLAQDLKGSYEECPPTLIDYAQRDQRWCQGNLQHIRLIFTSGFRPMSRLHLGIGAMSYLSSPLWMLSLVLSFLCVVFGKLTSADGASIPPADAYSGGGALFVATMAMLLLPKFWSYILLARDGKQVAQYGGRARLAVGVLVETLVSMIVAPIMMAFHTAFVATTLLGTRVSWNAQERDEQGLSLGAATAAHWRQTAAGLAAAVVAWFVARELFFWLSPILVGLAFSIPLSMILSSTAVGRWFAARRLLLIPEETVGNAVLSRSRELLTARGVRDAAKPGDTFRRVVADPALLALHCSILHATEPTAALSRRPLVLIERQLRSGRAVRISPADRKAVLTSAAALRTLHLFVWSPRRRE